MPSPYDLPPGSSSDQPSLLPDLTPVRRAAAEASKRTAAQAERTPAPEAAPVNAVAQVLVDVGLMHLDRAFDYLVPATLHDRVVPGGRVKVRFAGQDVDGYVLDRIERSEHAGRLTPVRRALTTEPVLTPEIARLVAAVAARYAGTRSDVLRLAIPPRRASVEKEPVGEFPGWPAIELPELELPVTAGADFLQQLASGESPRAVWEALPSAADSDRDWPAFLASTVAACASSSRGAVVCVPDHRDLARLDTALTDLLGPGHHVILTADLGPTPRYRAFLSLARGQQRIVIGTRAAAYAPVRDLGLVAVWDDGDDLHAEPRAPYPHTREVLLLRAHAENCGLLVAGFARTVEAGYLVRSGWASELRAERAVIRDAAPTVAISGASDHDLHRDPYARSARIPSAAHQLLRDALQAGPVLVQTPRHGYATTLVCDRCRTPARCFHCQGPLGLMAAHLPLACRWCGQAEPGWSCPACGDHGLRAPVLGDLRTAEELGRAFPGVPVVSSSGERVLAEVPSRPALVVATPGAEPIAAGGYAGALLLDTWLTLSRVGLRTEEESLRRFLGAAALVRADGKVLAIGDPADRVLQALVRWDPVGFAERELAQRLEAHLPPASRLATLTGPAEEVEAMAEALALPAGAEVLGPVPLPAAPGDGRAELVRTVVRVPRAQGEVLSRALRDQLAIRSARKLPAVRVQVDPISID